MRLLTALTVLFLSYIVLVIPLKADGVYLGATDTSSLSGPFVSGKSLSLVDDTAIGDFLLPTKLIDKTTKVSGQAVFSLNLPKAGKYTLWARIRFPSGKAEAFSIVFDDKEPVFVLGDGDSHNRKWHWVRMRFGNEPATISLKKGACKLTLRPGSCTERATSSWAYGMTRPMFCPRLNALYLSTVPDSIPDDEAASKVLNGKTVEKEKSVPKSPTRSPIPLEPVSDELLDRLGKKRIPDWMRCPRFFTKDSHRAELSHRQPGDIAQLVRTIADAHANAFRLSVYWGGDAFFQSKTTPHAPGLGQLDFLEEAVTEGRNRGVRIIAYMNPNAVYKTHPLCETVAIRDADGSPRDLPPYGRFKNARFPCINHPAYRKYLAEVIREIFERYHPAGLYLDGLSPHLCACEHCKAAYRKRWNEELPTDRLFAVRQPSVWWEMSAVPTPIGDPDDASMRRYTQFQAESLAEISKLISQTANSVDKEAVVIFHSWPKHDSAAYYDGTLTEVYVSRPWRHGLWKACELADFSNQFSVPTLFNIYNRRHFSSAEALTYATQGLAGGCFPNYWNIMGMKPVFAMMEQNEGIFDSLAAVPAPYAILPRATHLHPAQRRAATNRNGKPDKKAASKATDLFLAPYVGLYSGVTRGGFPLHCVDRGSFHLKLDNAQVLCLANEACLSDEQVEAVRQFVKRGGGLLATHETSLYDETGRMRDDFALGDLFGAHFRETRLAKTRRYHVKTSHPVVGEKDTTLLASDADIVSVAPTGGEVLATTEDGTPTVLVHQYGKGRVVYLPGRLAAEQCVTPRQEIENLFTSAMRHVGGPPPVEVAPKTPVLATAFDQPERRIIHLVNIHGDTQYRNDQIAPLEKVCLTVRPPTGRKIQSVRRLGKGNVHSNLGTEAVIELDRLGQYDVLVVELAP